MAENNYSYYLKDKKIDVWKGTKTSSYGVTTTVYSLLYQGLWAYYRQTQNGTTLDSGAIRVYDSTERATFIINKKPELRTETLSMLKIKYNGRVYDIMGIDDYDGASGDYKLNAQYSSSQSYPGMT